MTSALRGVLLCDLGVSNDTCRKSKSQAEHAIVTIKKRCSNQNVAFVYDVSVERCIPLLYEKSQANNQKKEDAVCLKLCFSKPWESE